MSQLITPAAALKKALQPVDIALLLDYLLATEVAAKGVEGKDIILLLGGSGAGKSTSILYLGGALMEERLVGSGTYKQPHLGAKIDPATQRMMLRREVPGLAESLSTVLTSPYPRFGETVQKFSCAWDCHYCPSEPNQPKSYLHDEPAVKRANENQFDAVLQLTDRAATLAMNG